MGKRLLSAYFRIDARSLGLFRVGMGLVLLGDLFRRWGFLRAFYSNEGVLPNHNHIFNLRDKTDVWSFLHAFSSVGENHFAFVLILLVYLGFLIGWKTRVFQVLALLCFVSLGSRNILLENQGNYAAVALLFFTAFLPLGSRYSVDSLLRSLEGRAEKNADELNERARPSESEIEATRGPGYSPLSIAALAVTLQIALILLSSALWHKGGAWKDGLALHYALYVERWVSDLGVSLRSAPAGLLKGLTYLLLAIEWAVPVLVLVPVLRRATRGIAASLLVVYGLVLGLFFSLGVYAWTLVAAAALLLPEETWEVFEHRFRPARARTVVYDADCGICLFLARLAKRLDTRGELAFQGNDDLSGLPRRKADGTIETVDLPSAVTADLVATSVVVVDGGGKVYTRSRAVAEVVRVFPFGGLLAFVMCIPGISNILDVVYDAIAKRRTNLSILVGLDACGVPTAEASDDASEEGLEVPSAVRARRFLTGGVREAFALLVFVAALAQASRENPLSFTIPQGKVLSSVVIWPRMLERWDVLASPEAETGVFVVDGQNRKGASVDPLTGAEPAVAPESFNERKLGQLWNDYLYRIHERGNEPFHKALRDFLGKGGLVVHGAPPDEQLSGYDAYWIRYTIAAPGVSPVRAEVGRDKLFTHSRGGRLATDRLPVIPRSVPRKD